MNDMQILGLFLILIIYVVFLIYCDHDINHRSRSRRKRGGKSQTGKSAAEIGVAASYISDSGGGD